MPPWTCPECDRSFGRRNQSHMCEPVTTVDAWFADRPPEFRRIHDAVVQHLESLGKIEVDPVEVGILIKRANTFAELRPKRGRLSLSVLLSRRLDHWRITRRIKTSGSRVAHFVDLQAAEDVDDDVREWLAESYFDSPT
jgi:hypothetical protein